MRYTQIKIIAATIAGITMGLSGAYAEQRLLVCQTATGRIQNTLPLGARLRGLKPGYAVFQAHCTGRETTVSELVGAQDVTGTVAVRVGQEIEGTTIAENLSALKTASDRATEMITLKKRVSDLETTGRGPVQ